MAMDKDDWGSSFGCDPDWASKKIKALEEKLAVAVRALEVASSAGSHIVDIRCDAREALEQIRKKT